MDKNLIQKCNMRYLTLEGTIFFIGIAFINQNTIVSLFINEYSGGLMLAGLAATIKVAASLIPKLIVGSYLTSIQDMPKFCTKLMMFARPLFILMVPFLLIFSQAKITVWIFLLLYLIFWCMNGVITMPWMDIFSRTVSIQNRGTVIGNQQLFGGIGAVLSGLTIKLILDNRTLSIDIKYCIIFTLGSLIMFLSSLAMGSAKDLPRKEIGKQSNILSFFNELPYHFKSNRAFTHMAVVECVAKISDVFVPFIIIFMRDEFLLNSQQISTLLSIQLAGSIIGGVLWGNLSKRLGNKYVIMLSQGIVLLYCSLTIYATYNKGLDGLFYLICCINILSSINSGSWLGFFNYTLDVSSEKNRPNLLVLRSLILFPISFFNLLFGALADHAGLIIIIIISGLASIIGLLLSTQLKPLKYLICKELNTH